jgi:hypothetical protein
MNCAGMILSPVKFGQSIPTSTIEAHRENFSAPDNDGTEIELQRPIVGVCLGVIVGHLEEFMHGIFPL